MAFGGPRSPCVRPGAHSARHQDSHNDWTPCRMAWPFVSAGAHAPHSDETHDPTLTWGASHSARRLRSLAFLCSSDDNNRKPLCRLHFNRAQKYISAIFDNKEERIAIDSVDEIYRYSEQIKSISPKYEQEQNT